MVCTELFGTAAASWQLRRRCGYRAPTKFLLRVLIPTAASVAVVLLLPGLHVVLVLAIAAAVYLAVNMAIGPVNWSTLTSLLRKTAPA